MKHTILIALILTGLATAQVTTYTNMNIPLAQKAGCGCGTDAERDAFMSRYARAQARILLEKYGLSAGVVLAGTQTAQGNLSGGVTYDTSTFISQTRPWDFVVVVSGWNGF